MGSTGSAQYLANLCEAQFLTAMKSFLQAQELFVARGGREVLKSASFAVGAGEIYALLGGNGAGKSTTLLTFLGFLDPSHGECRVLGMPVSEDIRASRQAIAYLPESAALYEHLSAYENLSYFLELAGLSIKPDQYEAALDRVSLDEAARHRKLADYSKGMRQKVAIALAMLRDSEILLLDEPTSGLDPVAIDEFHLLVRDLANGGKAILMVTHDVYGACQVADRIGLLRGGTVTAEFSAIEGQSIDTQLVHAAFTE